MNWEAYALGFLVGLLIYWFFRVLGSGAFTGNRYRKLDGRVQVKHPGEGWVYLNEHQAEQKRLRDNK